MAKAVSSNGSGRLPVAAWARLYEERVAQNLSQAAAAKQCGVSQQTFSGWEQKKHRPAKRHRKALAVFLHRSDAELVVELREVFGDFVS